MSPVHRVAARSKPALFIVGGDETRAFVEQNRRMHEAWRAAGHEGSALVVAGADHFTVLQAFAAPAGPLAEAIGSLVAGVRPASGRAAAGIHQDRP
jgi:arylformamidase